MSKQIKELRDKVETREGLRGTGHRLKAVCGFCRARFRSRRQRQNHTRHCKY
ncbi:MAG: hypothetical protein ACRDQZ_10350 [Mycobacteriales bacterium]